MKKSKLCTLILVSVVMFACGIILTACGGNKGGGNTETSGRAPIYLGMQISQSNPVAITSIAMQTSSQGGNSHGETTDRDKDINQNYPFDDIDNSVSIENKISSTLDVIASDQIEYYAEQNQDIFIAVKLSNPDNFEILSFTLNGIHYQSYQFQNGSDGQNLILKRNVGSSIGVMDYTIDAIKYVDGTIIKDVLIEGNKTIKAGVRTSGMTGMSISNEVIGLDQISFDAYLTDTYSLIDLSSGYAKAVLYDGREIVKTQNIQKGSNNISFTGLMPNKKYQYAVYAYFDNLSGSSFGPTLNVMKKNAFYTKMIVLFDNDEIEITKDSISFDFSWADEATDKIIYSLELYLDGYFVKTLTGNIATTLLSNNEYEIIATYKNLQNQNETIKLFATTYAKETPSIIISNVVPTTDSVSFALNITDVDAVGSISAIEIYQGITLVENLSNLGLREFNGLDGYEDYQIRVTYSYNLFDGNGEQSITDTQDIRTLANISVDSVQSLNSSAVSVGDIIYLDIRITNPAELLIETVTINDVACTPTGLSTKTRLYVNILVDENFIGGANVFEVNNITYKIDGVTYTVNATGISTSVFVNSELQVERLGFMNTSQNIVEHAVSGTTHWFHIQLKNDADYTVNSITIKRNAIGNDPIVYSGSNIVKIDANNYAVKQFTAYAQSRGFDEYFIQSITYSSVAIGSKTKSMDIRGSIPVVSSATVISVRTASDLKNMNANRIYSLDNDITLTGEWIPSEMNGVFYGNGFEIIGLNIVTTFEDVDVYLGLFSSVNGIIKDLTITNPTIIVTLNSTDSKTYNAYVGVVASNTRGSPGGNFSSASFHNVSVVNAIISVTNTTGGTSYVGGLTGCNYVYSCDFISNSIDGIISVNSNAYVGGLGGYDTGSSYAYYYNNTISVEIIRN